MEVRPVGFEGFDSAFVVAAVTLRESSSMRDVNIRMRQVSGSFALSDPIAFFCECRVPTCYSVIWMSARVFDAHVAGSAEWLLAEHHERSERHPKKQTLTESHFQACSAAG
jgi:hypothetical protein